MSMPMATGNGQPPARFSTVAAACAALLVWAALRWLSFDRVTTTVTRSMRWTRRSATVDEALRVLRSIDYAARFLPFRVACLERSLTAVLLLAARRRGVTWCMGVRTPPLASHAWIADQDGVPIGEPHTTAQYRTLRAISPTTQLDRRRT